MRSGGPGHVGYGEASGFYSLWDAMTPVLHSSLYAWLLLRNLAYDSGLGCVTCFHQWDISKHFKWRLEKHYTIGLPHSSSFALASLLETRTVEKWLGNPIIQLRDWTTCSSPLGLLYEPNQDPEKAMAPHFSTFAWKIAWTAEPGGLPSMGLHRVGHDWSDLAAAATKISWAQSNQQNLLYSWLYSTGVLWLFAIQYYWDNR